MLLAALVGTLLALATPAQALVGSPVTLAGPGSDVLDLGGVAMAPDGTGGAVFTKIVDGVPHVFASSYAGGTWSAPMRVDDQPYEASQPQIAAGRGGALLVVWVTQTATVKGQVRYGLFSASLGPGATSFGPSLLVDPDVGVGSFAGVDPSVSGTATGQAIVAYRVVTFRFDGSKASAIPQLRPGDVLSEVRVARLRDDRWARLGSVNVSQELSNRAPTETNGPQAGAGTNGGAVVAWQEADQSGAARIYLRRVFGTTFGPILRVSPEVDEAGRRITGDVDAYSLAATALNQARVAMRVLGNGGGDPTRIFLNSLPPDYAVPANVMTGAEQVFSAEPAVPLGVPSVAAYEKGGQEGLMRLAFAPGRRPRQASVGENGDLMAPAPVPGPASLAGTGVGAAVSSSGGATIAYPSSDGGSPAISVRQELESGAAESVLLSGPQTGPVGELEVAGSPLGDSLVGFLQGEAGHHAIVVARVSQAPTKLSVRAPKAWVKPRAVQLRWAQPQTNIGGLRYTVTLGGRVAAEELRRRQYHPPIALIGNGRVKAQVLATDALGQQVSSRRVTLKVDGEPPVARLAGPSRTGWVAVRLRDIGSGIVAKAARVRFGDGTVAAGRAVFRHRYERPGRYAIRVRARDATGNRMARTLIVRVP